jgi:hypothetical protein
MEGVGISPSQDAAVAAGRHQDERLPSDFGHGVQGQEGSLRKKASMEAKGKFVQQEMGNEDRRMILVDQSTREEEYDFEQDAEAVQELKIGFALARFYSGQDFSAWTVFNELSKSWGKKEAVPFRSLGDNHYIVEFDSEKLWRRVVNGGPWKFRGGDAMIFVSYDGVQRTSEIQIESIMLWVRIYDIPATMMTWFRSSARWKDWESCGGWRCSQ